MTSRRIALVFALSITAPVPIAAMACNDVLGNEEGTLRTGIGAAPTCASGEKLCGGACERLDNPNYGCGGSSCDPCAPKNVITPTCGGSPQSCAFDRCSPGFGDCDGKKDTGCETPTDTADNCGGCGNKCDATKPYCSVPKNAGDPYRCTKDCAGVLCGTTCFPDAASLNTVDHCGSCENKCTQTGTSAEAACKTDTTPPHCGLKCIGADLSECADGCYLFDSDPKHCGGCTKVCPSGGPHTHPTCSKGGCQLQCDNGWTSCDDDLTKNGCETPTLAGSPALCGTSTSSGGSSSTSSGGSTTSSGGNTTSSGGSTTSSGGGSSSTSGGGGTSTSGGVSTSTSGGGTSLTCTPPDFSTCPAGYTCCQTTGLCGHTIQQNFFGPMNNNNTSGSVNVCGP